MVNECVCCTSLDRYAIDTQLMQGASVRAIAAAFGVSKSAVGRHRSNCLLKTGPKAQAQRVREVAALVRVALPAADAPLQGREALLREIAAEKAALLAMRQQHEANPVAVLAIVDRLDKLWNRLLEELTDLQDARIAMERLLEMTRDSSTGQTFEDVEAELTANGYIDA